MKYRTEKDSLGESKSVLLRTLIMDAQTHRAIPANFLEITKMGLFFLKILLLL